MTRSRLLAFLWAVLVVAIVAGIVVVGFYKLQQPPASATNVPESTQPSRVIVGHDYYVLVKLVEFAPLKPNGSHWDRGMDTAPDPKVDLYWHNSLIFELPTRQDQYIATWDLFRVNIADIVRSGGNVDIASSINAPLVQVWPDAPLTIEVWDSDVIYDDLALRIKLSLQDLHPGDNEIPIPKGSGLRRLVVQLLDRETPLDQLVTMAQNGKA